MILGNLCNFQYFEFLMSMWHCHINTEQHNSTIFILKKNKGKREGNQLKEGQGPAPSLPTATEKWQLSKKSQQCRNQTQVGHLSCRHSTTRWQVGDKMSETKHGSSTKE